MTPRAAAARSSSAPTASGSALSMARMQSRAASCSLSRTLIVPPADDAPLLEQREEEVLLLGVVVAVGEVAREVDHLRHALHVDVPGALDVGGLGLHRAHDQHDVFVFLGQLTRRGLGHRVSFRLCSTRFPEGDGRNRRPAMALRPLRLRQRSRLAGLHAGETAGAVLRTIHDRVPVRPERDGAEHSVGTRVDALPAGLAPPAVEQDVVGPGAVVVRRKQRADALGEREYGCPLPISSSEDSSSVRGRPKRAEA